MLDEEGLKGYFTILHIRKAEERIFGRFFSLEKRQREQEAEGKS